MEHIENDDKFQGLAVNKGISSPPTINPYLKRSKRAKKQDYSVNDYVERILKGDISILNQAVTLVESTLSNHYNTGQEVIEKLLPYAGN